MISKELLSKVIGLDILAVYGEANSILTFKFDESCGNQIGREGKINIYELAHECKEWAENKNHIIYSHIDRCHSPARQVGVATIGNQVFRGYYGTNESEPEAVLKACEWILENEKDKL